MNCYEVLVTVRPDISSAKLEETINKLTTIIENHQGSIEKKENWGIRDLAYEIKKNYKAHYVLLGIKINAAAIRTLGNALKQNENIIRHSILKVDSISLEPSYLLRDNDDMPAVGA